MKAAVGFLVAATLLLAGVLVAGPALAPRDGHGAAIAAARELIDGYADELDAGTTVEAANAALDHVQGAWVTREGISKPVVAVLATTYPGSSMADLDDPVRVGACFILSGRVNIADGCLDAWSALPHKPDFLVTPEDE
ncbi:hypothetical protein Afil01_63530 [Actinorhabdospora filicis]|uniref:Uncharacterized protein n=1 Tax=Actinorhabdospora filicis TaxID=1785913 RepID=A0A9W6WDF0_9ACTN|nr:hypothetical protein [Actinorhabdospora filicis]GLZ81546.1 hypothetical protein Afil01_63530 [Actinorhabdospora filicis]